MSLCFVDKPAIRTELGASAGANRVGTLVFFLQKLKNGLLVLSEGLICVGFECIAFAVLYGRP